jgi:RNA polymerase sigma-70 factor, ECF subfamily
MRFTVCMELNALLKRCQQGDELAWEILVRQYQSRVFGIAYQYVGNREDARDLAQDIFIRLYRHLHTCTDSGRFFPWLMRMARNAGVDFLRRRKARPPATDVPAERLDSIGGGYGNPEEEWTAHVRRQLLQRALQELSTLSREIILLKDIQGMALDEIASILNIPLGTAKSRSNRARLELAEKLLTLGQGQFSPAATARE